MIKSGFLLNENISNTVFLAKGIGISLVVLGHFYFPEHQPDTWLSIRSIIYYYHMPLFMFLAGFLYAYTNHNIKSKNEYTVFVKKKIKRLMIPYATLGILLALLKVVFLQFTDLGQPIDNQFYMYLLFNPEAEFTVNGGYARFLWFLYTLFVIFLLYPILEMLLKKRIYVFLLVLLLNYYEYPAYFCIDHAIYHLPYFALGAVILEKYMVDDGKEVDMKLVLYLSLLITVSALSLEIYFDTKNQLLLYLIGTSGAVFILYFCRFLSELRIFGVVGFMKQIGVFSATIYLFHFIFMSPLIFIGYGYFDITKELFLPLIVTVYIIGVTAPIIFEQFFLSRSKWIMAGLLGK